MRLTDTVQIVCFDLGGVLVRICETWDEARRLAGLAPRGEPIDRVAGDERRLFTELLDLGRISVDDWAAGISKALGGAYTVSELTRLHHALCREEHAGAASLVDALHDAQMETACLSNTNHAHFTRLVHHDGKSRLAGEPEYPGVARLKQHFASHLLGVAKPDDAIYTAFEAKTGLSAQAILFFDDRLENIDGALRRGWRAHRIDPLHDTVAQLREQLRRYRVLE